MISFSLQGIISVMEENTYELVEATFYRNTIEESLTPGVYAALPLDDAKALEKKLNQAMMEKDGILGVHYGTRADGGTQTYMDYFMVEGQEKNNAAKAANARDAIKERAAANAGDDINADEALNAEEAANAVNAEMVNDPEKPVEIEDA